MAGRFSVVMLQSGSQRKDEVLHSMVERMRLMHSNRGSGEKG